MLADIINVMLEELAHHHYELPGFTVLKRIARAARNKVNEGCFREISQNLTHGSKQKIDELLNPSDGAYGDRKSTRLNSSHVAISYAVFCLKKKKNAKRKT